MPRKTQIQPQALANHRAEFNRSNARNDGKTFVGWLRAQYDSYLAVCKATQELGIDVTPATYEAWINGHR
jgi:hypothetical protein